jgi:hypothetical protein
MHSDKFCEKVFQEMGHKIILGHFETEGDKFYITRPYISALYLIVLAGEMSKKINSPMLTDIFGLSGFGQYVLWSNEIIPYDTGQKDILMQLEIDFPSKEELVLLSFDDIIRFRENRKDERRRFRRIIEDIRNRAQGLEDPNALIDYLNDQKQEIQQSISDHKKTLDDIGIKHLTSSIKAAWPSLFGIVIGNVAGEAAGILSAIGLAGVSISCDKTVISQEYQKAIKDCPWHYLINLEQELS